MGIYGNVWNRGSWAILCAPCVLYIDQLTLKMGRKDDIKFILFHALWRELPCGVIHDCTQPFRRDNLSLLHPAHPFISVCLSISPSIHLSIFLSLHLPMTLSLYSFIYLCTSIGLSSSYLLLVQLSIILSIYFMKKSISLIYLSF